MRSVHVLQVRDKEANIDNLINPIEDMYALLMRYQVAVPKEEGDLVSDLHYSWKKLRKLATDVSNKLAKLQVGFKRELIKQVNTFVVEAKTFKCAAAQLAAIHCHVVMLLLVSQSTVQRPYMQTLPYALSMLHPAFWQSDSAALVAAGAV